MPTYKYRREDGTTFTIRQKITADPLEEDPETGQKVERVITGGMGFHLKGSGWYADGYASTDASGSENGAADSDETSSASENGSSSEKSNAETSEASSANDAPSTANPPE